MQAMLDGPGFLGSNAPFISDLSLVLILLTAVMFTIGWQLARRRHFETHRWVQTAAVAINTVVAMVVMVNSFVTHILPGIPSKLLEGDYAVTTLHAAVGTAAVLLGVFVVLRGNNLVPKPLRFSNFKLFMRTSYIIYMVATVLGVAVYILAFVLGI